MCLTGSHKEKKKKENLEKGGIKESVCKLFWLKGSCWELHDILVLGTKKDPTPPKSAQPTTAIYRSLDLFIAADLLHTLVCLTHLELVPTFVSCCPTL